MCKVQQEKEALKKHLEQAKKLAEKDQKTFWKEIVKAYELMRTYFIGKARTQWDKTVLEMRVGLSTTDRARGTGIPSWTASSSTS